MTSPTSGHVSTEGNYTRRFRLYARNSIHVPNTDIVILSFPLFKCYPRTCYGGFGLYTQGPTDSNIKLLGDCKYTYADMHVFHTNNITLKLEISTDRYTDSSCFKMLFSFHPKSEVPQRLSSGLYNCSVDHYWRFRQHLDCNMKVGCEDGRDEVGHCPFSSPACHGWLALRHKCIKYVSRDSIRKFESNASNFYTKAVQYCSSLNAKIGTVHGRDVLEKAYKSESMLYGVLGYVPTLYGEFTGGLSVPNIYRYSTVADDKYVLHKTYPWLTQRHNEQRLCSIFSPQWRRQLPCSSPDYTEPEFNAVCEFQENYHHKSETIVRSNVPFALARQIPILTRCQSGEVTHTFIACCPHNACGQGCAQSCTLSNSIVNRGDRDHSADSRTLVVPVFTCGDDITSLSYTLVCDFRQDCPDHSDESFCQHPPCDRQFTCTSGQCVSYSKRCDLVSDCMDDSDEKLCDSYVFFPHIRNVTSPVLISFDGIKHFTVVKMNPNESCPDTHYRCPGEHNDCLPVYTRCNGWYDCMDHEDEDGCEKMTCPGFYRCFTSTVCVHADHLCDGWPHCPQRDDEWLCDMTCPAGCLCQGHAFLCPQSFSAHLFPQLRYLDAQGSGMSPSDLNNNSYIVHLSLSQCSLAVLPVLQLLNVQFLDLSSNELKIVNMIVFAVLVHLRTLRLEKNPIHLVHSDSASVVPQTALRTIDLSRTKLKVFDSKALANYPYLHSINLSFTTIHTIRINGFRFTSHLRNLYMEGSPVKLFPPDVLKPLSRLRVITALTYKLCCKTILPDHFELITCDAPKNEISSCEDLLQSVSYRAFLWLISFLSVLGNVCCFVVRVCVQRTVSTSGFHVFVTNLSMSDLLMGVYIVVIGVADVLFRGMYLHYDDTWTHSVACKVAGFLSLLSCEVSALIIWLITLDRFIVLHFPFSSLRFQRTSAIVACIITWLAGGLLASVPLFPTTSHWEFYSQTGICIPLPVTRQDFKGRVYSVSVFLVFNFVLFLLIAAGQAFIYWSVQKNALKTDSTKSSRDLIIARRLISVAVTDFMCWFPIGLCGLLASAGIPIPGEVNVALAIFVLPLNSALNPFMYTFNMLMEKRRKSKESMFLKWLESHSDLLDKQLLP